MTTTQPNLTKKSKLVRLALERLGLTPLKPIAASLTDPTRKSYSAVVADKKKTKFFIKIRISDDQQQRTFFRQSYFLACALNKHKPRLYNLTPKLLAGQIDQAVDFLLYEFIPGKNMGSRTRHDLFRFTRADLPNIGRIYQAVGEISPSWLPLNFLRRQHEFYRFLLLEDVPFDERALASVYTETEIELIRALAENKNLAALLDNYATTLQHGDFQAPNFIKTDTGKLMLLDFDQCSLTNRFYDPSYFYNHAFRRPRLREQLLQAMLPTQRFSEEEQLLFYFNRFTTAFVWIKVFLKKRRWYRRRNLPDLAIRQHAFRLRVNDTKRLLAKTAPLIQS